MSSHPQTQQELPLPFPELSGDLPLLPVRMVNEYEYCPRLAYLEWVQGEWADSADTVDGRYQHRRVDRRKGKLPEADEREDDDKLHARSITLSSNRLGIIARIDLVEGRGNEVTPVEYKRGKRPHVSKGAYQPERIQVCAQGLILEEQGYECNEGIIYFTQSRERVRVKFDDELRQQTLSAINGLRLVAATSRIPPPLQDSPKCPRCSLVGICLPDEINLLRGTDSEPRPLAASAVHALPLYVQANNAKVSKKGQTLEVSIDGERAATARLIEVSQLVVMGNAYITTPTLHELMRREIPITWHSYGGWFLGHSVGMGHKNVELRMAQYKGSFDTQVCHYLARGLVRAKILNSRTLMRRNWRREDKPTELMRRLRQFADKASRADDLNELLGYEGTAASEYFRHFGDMIRRDDETSEFQFDFNGRNRRPPTDPINAMLSFAYAMLSRTWSVTLSGVGFDPYRGFYHQPRYGRPALALDMMEPFRPLLADSAVLTAVNNGEVRPSDFVSAAGSVNLSPSGRKRFIAAFERRMSQKVTHPVFGYRISYRRLLEVQARLLARFLMGEIREYPNFMTR
ncbi:CRISPR-associated endonuclease Cas1 [Wenzhouxiangella sp. AB-CW3]|uniref:CRISPR-associated endonuclease Cas4g/Cas1g n=1 Tax=Wenzhouxiangella sp. AB-CW3 TaxID=2771012 RepID=UPI00168ACFCF|nr:CRISPR-associated endonuclease Cas1 [Wenzhouxiangella sp. AB-CW3]QOC21491.1 CRISPR-associated endonuclease Cas1 [Wenzhouxiangella sp. AB-CW3]